MSHHSSVYLTSLLSALTAYNTRFRIITSSLTRQDPYQAFVPFSALLRASIIITYSFYHDSLPRPTPWESTWTASRA